MTTTRTLARMVRKMERVAGAGDAALAWRRRQEHERTICDRIAANPAACAAMDAAAVYLARSVPLGADVRDYPEAVRLMGEVEEALSAPQNSATE